MKGSACSMPSLPQWRGGLWRWLGASGWGDSGVGFDVLGCKRGSIGDRGDQTTHLRFRVNEFRAQDADSRLQVLREQSGILWRSSSEVCS